MILFLEFCANDVEGAACFEPADLLLVVGVVKRDIVGAAVLVMKDHRQRFAGRERGEAGDVDAVVFLYFVVIFLVGKSEGEHSLFL